MSVNKINKLKHIKTTDNGSNNHKFIKNSYKHDLSDDNVSEDFLIIHEVGKKKKIKKSNFDKYWTKTRHRYHTPIHLDMYYTHFMKANNYRKQEIDVWDINHNHYYSNAIHSYIRSNSSGTDGIYKLNKTLNSGLKIYYNSYLISNLFGLNISKYNVNNNKYLTFDSKPSNYINYVNNNNNNYNFYKNGQFYKYNCSQRNYINNNKMISEKIEIYLNKIDCEYLDKNNIYFKNKHNHDTFFCMLIITNFNTYNYDQIVLNDIIKIKNSYWKQINKKDLKIIII